MEFCNLLTGKTDARNEVILNNQKSIDNFMQIFVKPQGFPLDEFLDGENYFISGLKGTGKTALLKYIGLNLEDKYSADFVYFKSDLKEDDREEIEQFSTFQVIDDGIEKKDFEKAWKWFIIRRLVENNPKTETFIEDINYERAKKHLLAVSLEKSKKGISYFFPKIVNGNVKINLPKDTEVSLELEFLNKEENEVRFNDVVDKCYDLFLALKPKKPIFLFVDELELSYLSKKSYERDASLIRDLIVTIKELNQEFREWEMGIYIVAAIRAEVINAVSAIGKEISKHIEDFGYELSWNRYESKKLEHPLIKMVINRLRVSEEKFNNGKCNLSNEELWKKYFSERFFGQKSQSIILNNTWFRPRDLIRWLNVVKKNFPQTDKVTQQIFESGRKDYSRKCLNEVFEELNTIYSHDELDGVEKLFTSFKSDFSPKELIERIEKFSETDNDIKKLVNENRNFNRFLDHMYSCGIIGNKYNDVNQKGNNVVSVRWYCRGDKTIIHNKRMSVHFALRSVLTIRDY